MIFIWLIISIFALYLLAKNEDKIGRNSHLYHFLLFIILFIIAIILWDILGFDFGGGGSPYGEMFNE